MAVFEGSDPSKWPFLAIFDHFSPFSTVAGDHILRICLRYSLRYACFYVLPLRYTIRHPSLTFWGAKNRVKTGFFKVIFRSDPRLVSKAGILLGSLPKDPPKPSKKAKNTVFRLKMTIFGSHGQRSKILVWESKIGFFRLKMKVLGGLYG